MDPNKKIARLTVDGQVVYYRPGEVIAIGDAAADFVRDERTRQLRTALVQAMALDDTAQERLRTALDETSEDDSDLTDAVRVWLRAALGEPIEDVSDLTDAVRVWLRGALDEPPEEVRSTLAADLDLARIILAKTASGDKPSHRVSMLPPAFRFGGVDDADAVVDLAASRGLRVQLNHVFFSHCGCGCDPCCGGNPYGAFPYKATPYKATPYKATPYKATAPAETSAKETAAPAQGLAAAKKTANGDAESGSTVQNVNVWVLDTGIADSTIGTPLGDLGDLVTGQPRDRPDQLPQPVDRKVDPVAGHGTFIAGIIAELAPHSRIWISQLIGPAGDLDEWDVSEEIHKLLGDSARNNDLPKTILNLSFGGSLYSACNPLVGEAIAAAQEAGVVVVASAGNDASCLPVYPANFPGVTSVGALDRDGDPATFTNRGSWVDACALGVDIVSTFFDFSTNSALDNTEPRFTGWAVWSGTSFATPVVVGLIANEMRGGKLAVDARDSVLARGIPVPCLGVRVHDPDIVPRLEMPASKLSFRTRILRRLRSNRRP